MTCTVRPAFLGALALLLALQGWARADTPPSASNADFAVPVETLTLGGASGKFLEQGFKAGGYTFFSFNYSSGQSTTVFGIGSSKTKQKVDYRFVKSADNAVIAQGQCRNDGKDRTYFGLTVQGNSGLYNCDFKDLTTADYALQMQVPSGVQGASIGFFSASVEADFRQFKGKMIYRGVAYEAAATGPGDNTPFHRRAVKGYRITRDGRPVGAVVIDPTDIKSTITAPVADADGREAVIFFAGQLIYMPEPAS